MYIYIYMHISYLSANRYCEHRHFALDARGDWSALARRLVGEARVAGEATCPSVFPSVHSSAHPSVCLFAHDRSLPQSAAGSF